MQSISQEAVSRAPTLPPTWNQRHLTQTYVSSSLNFPPSLLVHQTRLSPSDTQVIGKVPYESHSLQKEESSRSGWSAWSSWNLSPRKKFLSPVPCVPGSPVAHGSQYIQKRNLIGLTPKSMGQGCSISHSKREKPRTENVGSRSDCPMQSTLSTIKLLELLETLESHHVLQF